jgi:uncharacterized RDD family membrane protein YckC
MVTVNTAAPPRSVHVAGFWRRALAGAVDLLVLAAVFVVLDVGVQLLLGHPLPRLSQLGPDYLVDVAINGDALAEIGLLLLAIVGFLYFFLFQALRGQTPGQALIGIRVIDGYGEPPSFGRALVRTFAIAPSVLLLALGVLWIAFDREKRALHDRLADTYVIIGEPIGARRVGSPTAVPVGMPEERSEA